MKKKLLLILPITMVLAGCKITIFNRTISIFEKKSNDSNKQEVTPSGETKIIDDVEPEDPTQHATSMSTTPNAPFYLKVGETKDISVSLSPAPELASEKIVEWNLVGDYLDYKVDQNNTYKVKVTGKTPGVAKLTATNTYNDTLTKTFTINVIDFDEENDYLWQYQSSDRAQFGYDNSTAKQGTEEGNADLNGISWHYKRNKVTSLQSSMGAVGFGKGSDPETHVHFETTIDRRINKFTIEAASANSLAKMTIKVGETIYMNEKVVPKDSYDVIGTIFSDAVTPDGGKIEIDVYTPEYDSSREEDPTYKKPGAFYLKSILINFEEMPAPVFTKTFNFKEMYDEEGNAFDNLTTSAKSISMQEDGISLSFASIKKESSSDEKIPGYAHSNGAIDIYLNRENEVFSNIEFTITYGTSSSKNYYYYSYSKSGGAPYVSTSIKNVIVEEINGLLKVSVLNNHINAIRLFTQNSYNVGLVSLTIQTREGIQGTIKEIAVPDEFVPDKLNYIVGEEFDVTGLANLSIVYNEESIASDSLAPSELDWFDGVSYDSDPSNAVKTLSIGTTYVYGIFRGQNVVKIEGLTVEDQLNSLTIVKNVSELNSNNHYYLIAKDSKALVKGSAGGNMGKANSGIEILNFESIGESLSISGIYNNDYFIINPQNDGTFVIKNADGNTFGMTNTGNLSTAKSPDNKKFAITINAESGAPTYRIEKSSDATLYRYFGYDTSSSCVKLSTTEMSNLFIYKVN